MTTQYANWHGKLDFNRPPFRAKLLGRFPGGFRMITFRFTATCGDQSLPLEVKLAFRPGKQSQRARRAAVGELLAMLEVDSASVDPAGEDQLKVKTAKGTWVIGEAKSPLNVRGRI